MRLLDGQTRIAPFGDLAADLPLCGARFADRQAAAAAASGADDRLTLADHAIATPEVLARFAATHPGGGPAGLALPAAPALVDLCAASSVRRDGDRLLFDVFLDAPPDAPLEALRAEAKPVEVDLGPETYVRPLPRLGPAPHEAPTAMGGPFAAHLEHWAHLLWIAPLWVPRLSADGPGRRVRGRRSRAPSRVAKTADVHPSAYLEGAVIAEGAEVGAGCVLRHTYVGPNSRLSDFTKAAHCVLGEDTHTLADATFEHVVALGGGTLTNLLLQDSLLGRQVFLTTGVVFWRDALGETISVERDGAWVDTGRRVLGGCAGHGSVLGARTILAPGRALPNRTTVVMRKAEGVHRVDGASPGEPVCGFGGALVPPDRVVADYVAEEVTP